MFIPLSIIFTYIAFAISRTDISQCDIRQKLNDIDNSPHKVFLLDRIYVCIKLQKWTIHNLNMLYYSMFNA